MHINLKTILTIFTTSIWISISETIRNEFLFKYIWLNHYQKLGLEFPSNGINALVWWGWAVTFSVLIYITYKKYTFKQTVIISWVYGFILMWLVLFNLAVLPLTLLIYAIPLSILEVIIAVLIIKNLSKTR